MSNINRAFDLYVNGGKDQTRNEFIDRLVSELGMSKGSATTYFYNCKKKFEGTTTKEVVTKKIKEVTVTPVAIVAPVVTVDPVPVKKSKIDSELGFELPAFLKKSAEHWDKFGYAKM